jgi:hypothetical protein
VKEERRRSLLDDVNFVQRKEKGIKQMKEKRRRRRRFIL